MFLDHGKHGQQFQNTKYVPGSWWTWEANTRLVFLSWVFLLLTLLWWEENFFPFQRWENILILQMPEIELNLGNSKVKFEDIVANGLSRFVFSSTLVFFVGFRFIALLKDCVLTGWQVYCQVSQLWKKSRSEIKVSKLKLFWFPSSIIWLNLTNDVSKLNLLVVAIFLGSPHSQSTLHPIFPVIRIFPMKTSLLCIQYSYIPSYFVLALASSLFKSPFNHFLSDPSPIIGYACQ